MARRLELAARGWRAPARPIAARGARGAGWGEGAPPRSDLGAGIAVAAAGSPAGPARRGAAGAGVGGGAGGGEGGRPLRPAPCALPLRRVTFRRQRGLERRARAPGWALGASGRREAVVPREEAPGRTARKRGGEGSELWDPVDCAQGRGGRREQRRCLPIFPRERSGVSGPGQSGRASRADGEISRCGASAETIFIRPGNVSERLPGTAQYGERSFVTAPEGGERASTAWRSGAALLRPRAAFPPPDPRPPASRSPTRPRLPPPQPCRG